MARPGLRWLTALAVWILASSLAGCAAPPLTRALLGEQPQNIPSQVELEAVPFYPQELFQCGPASLAMVLQHRGKQASPEQLKEEVYLPAREGSLQIEMVAAARARGLLVYPLGRSLNHLVEELAAGHPVLVLQNLGLDWYPTWHYAVVIGYDLAKRELVQRSGTTERLQVPMATFERTWERANHWAILTLPPDRLPATATPEPYLNAAKDLERVGQLQAAFAAYTQAVQAWPELELGWMGQGNTAYALRDFDQAIRSYTKVLADNPGYAAGWNNLAYAYAGKGCAAEAVASAFCAVSLAPGDANAAATLADMLGLAEQANAAEECVPVVCPQATP